MTTIIGIAGSLRKASFNAALLHAAANAVPADTRLEIASIRDIPLYDEDLEEQRGIPLAVQQLKERIASADGLVPSSSPSSDRQSANISMGRSRHE